MGENKEGIGSVVLRCFSEAFLAPTSAAMMAASEEIILLDLTLRAGVGAGAGSRRRTTTKKMMTDGPIYPNLWRRRKDQGGDRYQE